MKRIEDIQYAAAYQRATSPPIVVPKSNIFSMIGEGFGSVAAAGSAGASGGSAASSGYSSGGGASSGGSSSDSSGYDRASQRANQAHNDRMERQQNDAIRRNVEQKLWNMNNPYK